MPKPNTTHPLPRGTLSLNLTEWLLDQVASGAATVTAPAGNYAQVGLTNFSSTGYLLYVVGCAVWTNDPAGGVTLRLTNVTPPAGTMVATQTLNPLVGAIDGNFGYATAPSIPGGVGVWRMSGGNTSDFWPYDAPIAILPTGWSIYTAPDNMATTVSASYRWIALRG